MNKLPKAEMVVQKMEHKFLKPLNKILGFSLSLM